ncbi:hypothetical protein CFII64_20543 [Pseudomonas sp. CFII64]|nr:hypothetical protein CFII64_20543 [Pseudomonas sp. CFII64]
MFDLLEALGKAHQPLVGNLELGQVIGRPFTLLQPLPSLKDLARLMDDSLSEVMLEPVSAWIF